MCCSERTALLTLHVHNQQCVADGQRCPKPERLGRRQKLLVDDGHRGQHSHKEGDGYSPGQQGQQRAA